VSMTARGSSNETRALLAEVYAAVRDSSDMVSVVRRCDNSKRSSTSNSSASTICASNDTPFAEVTAHMKWKHTINTILYRTKAAHCMHACINKATAPEQS
jgi:hypothetical protein